MKMIRTIPGLPVINIAEAVRFYESRFGFMSTYHDQGFAKLIRDEVELHLWAASDMGWQNRDLAARPIFSGAESFLAGTSGCRIEVHDIDNFYSEYKQQSVLYNADTTIQTTPWNTREFPTLDHHRNLLTFFERIKV